jgi:hypothetical protein
VKAVLFDAGNTLIYLDHERMAAEVGTALGLPITAAALDRSAHAATRAVEGAAGVAAGRTDRERARVAVLASSVKDGTIASSNGKATAVPIPRRNVLRGRLILLTNMASRPPHIRG